MSSASDSYARDIDSASQVMVSYRVDPLRLGEDMDSASRLVWRSLMDYDSGSVAIRTLLHDAIEHRWSHDCEACGGRYGVSVGHYTPETKEERNTRSEQERLHTERVVEESCRAECKQYYLFLDACEKHGPSSYRGWDSYAPKYTREDLINKSWR